MQKGRVNVAYWAICLATIYLQSFWTAMSTTLLIDLLTFNIPVHRTAKNDYHFRFVNSNNAIELLFFLAFARGNLSSFLTICIIPLCLKMSNGHALFHRKEIPFCYHSQPRTPTYRPILWNICRNFGFRWKCFYISHRCVVENENKHFTEYDFAMPTTTIKYKYEFRSKNRIFMWIVCVYF